jgi:tetrapyrrole methylase family protein/MazG family protein/ATP diphosphatase
MPARLAALIRRLRHPQTGCPWDRQQTPRSLASPIIEEAFELVEAIEQGEPPQVMEEAGDLLFQLFFVIHLFSEQKLFDAQDVAVEVESKMIRRHPHVFGNEKVNDSNEVLTRWEQIKQSEGKSCHPLDSIPRSLPALARSQRLWGKARRLDWLQAETTPTPALLRQLLMQVLDSQQGEDLARFLLMLAAWAGNLGLDAEQCLRQANMEFQERVKALHKA